MIEYKGYTGVFEYDPDLETFSGHLVDLRDQIHFEGNSVEELKSSMIRAVDHYLEVCRLRGEEPDRPFSGRFNVRFGPALHRRVAKAAAAAHESMNDWLMEAAERRLAESR
jgi:predicted HicB family RNase H-like nuclease